MIKWDSKLKPKPKQRATVLAIFFNSGRQTLQICSANLGFVFPNISDTFRKWIGSKDTKGFKGIALGIILDIPILKLRT